MHRGGHNLGLRYQQLESSVRSTARKAALLEVTTGASRSVEQHNSLVFSDVCRTPREEIEMFHGLAVPKEPKPPESDGRFPERSFILSLILNGLVSRMLYVRVCGLRLRSLRGLSLDVQSVACFASDAAEVDEDPTVGVAFTRQVSVEFSDSATTV